jgi:hypothetical protein
LDLIQKILKRFPDINSDWLIFGKGTMFNSPDLFSAIETPTEKIIKAEPIPIQFPEKEIVEKVIPVETVVEAPILEVEKEKIREPKEEIRKKPKLEEKPVVQINTEPEPSQNITMKPVGKKIERIIIFYSDKSCIEYIPE